MTSTASTFALRNYQDRSLDNIADLFLSGQAWRQLLVLATGLGKTVVFSHLHQQPRIAAWLDTYEPQHRKMLVIAHREELLTQAANKIRQSNPDLLVEIEQATAHASPMADVVVASVQTIASRSCRRLMRFNLDAFRTVVIDEAHHAVANSYVEVLQAFGFLPDDSFMASSKPPSKTSNEVKLQWQRERIAAWDAANRPDTLLLGVTATPSRGDKVGLEAIFQQVAFNMDIRAGITEGFLSPIRAYRVLTTTCLDEVATRAGDFAVDQLAQTIDNPERNYQAVAAYLAHAEGRQAVAFCASVAHAQHMAACFNAAGIPAEPVYGNMDAKRRKEALTAFDNRGLRVLTNAMLLTEGWDSPHVGCILQARPTKSQALYVQMAGRGTRLAPGKENCILIDLVDVARKHSLMTSADLVGLPAGFDADGGDLIETARALEAAVETHPGLSIDGLKNLSELAVKVEEVDLWTSNRLPEILEASKLAWRKNQQGEYMICLQDAMARLERVVVTQDAHGYSAALEKFGKRKPLVPPQPTLAAAFQEAEAWSRRMRPQSAKRLDRSLPWRDEPASKAQIDVLTNYKLPIDPRTLTKGEASDVIDNARYERMNKHVFAVVGKK